MTDSTLRTLIQQELPQLVAQDPAIRDFILRTVSDYYASKPETESRFDQILEQLERDRQEQARKWEENGRRFDAVLARFDTEKEEQAQKWDEQRRLNQSILEEIRQMNCKHESTIGALGSRWGLASEASFRNALQGILGRSFGVQVLNLTLYDQEGEVFGRPDQVEIDIIIQNGMTIACEIKSSIDKAGMYSFGRKADFYAKHENRTIDRKIVISPMVDSRALPVAEALGIEIYSYAEDVPSL
ncbi:MAG: PD-(D/E)XK nuclease family protein [Cyanobacteriota bacterium]|jgi:hypothetical protein